MLIICYFEGFIFLGIYGIGTISISTIPTYILIQLFSLIFVSDLVLKFLLKNNNTDRPAFLENLPIAKREWCKYIIVHNLFTFWNFYIIALVIPPLLFTCSLSTILTFSSIAFCISLLNNALCICINKLLDTWGIVSNKKTIFTFGLGKSFLSHKLGNISFFKLEFIYLVRSKRLLMLLFLPTVIFVIIICQSIFGHNYDPNQINAPVYFILFIPIVTLGQYAFGVEANFFSGIITKPISFVDILENKYLFRACLTGAYTLLMLPLVYFGGIDLYIYLAAACYAASIFNLFTLPVILYTNRIDLNTSSFMNRQGNSVLSMFYIMLFLLLSALIVIPLFVFIKNTFMVSGIIFFMSLVTFLIRKPVLSAIAAAFLKIRYRKIEQYLSK